ncbi:hypothetical protein [Pirellulimonas nuda]|nr:hypothetical protein [Pirellulimonas nuda]
MAAVSVAALDRVQQLLRSSFVRYLAQTSRLAAAEDQTLTTLHDIADDQQDMADRLAEQLRGLDGMPGAGAYPMAFTDSHDLALGYLLQRAVKRQREDAAALRAEAERPGLTRTAKMLLEEAHGMTLGHLQVLESEIQSSSAAAASRARQ